MDLGIGTLSLVLGAGLLPLSYKKCKKSRQGASESLAPWLLAPWFLLAISAAVSGYVINEQAAVSAKSLKEQGRELTAARADVSTYRDILQAQIQLPFRGGQPWLAHKVLLGTEGTKHVRILGINGLGVLHGHRQSLQEILTEPEHTIDVLLLHPKSDAFKRRAEEEEKKKRLFRVLSGRRSQIEFPTVEVDGVDEVLLIAETARRGLDPLNP